MTCYGIASISRVLCSIELRDKSPTHQNFEMAITSPSNGCNDLYPLEFVVQLLNGTCDDPLDKVLLEMNLCSTEQGMFRHQRLIRSGEVLVKSGLLTRR